MALKTLARPGRDAKSAVQAQYPDAIAKVDSRRLMVVIKAGAEVLAEAPYTLWPSCTAAWNKAAEAIA